MNYENKKLDENGYTITTVQLVWPVDDNTVNGVYRLPSDTYIGRVFAPKVDISDMTDEARYEGPYDFIQSQLDKHRLLGEIVSAVINKYRCDRNSAIRIITKAIQVRGQQDNHGDYFYPVKVLSQNAVIRLEVEALKHTNENLNFRIDCILESLGNARISMP